MNDTTAETSTALVSLNLNLPAPAVVAEQVNKAFHTIYGKIEEEIASFVPDISTEKGRAAIASLAYKIARTKTGLDKAAQAVTADQKQIIDAVNAERKKMREDLESLQDKVRAPLDRYEADQKAKADRADIELHQLACFRVDCAGLNSTELKGILGNLKAHAAPTEAMFGDKVAEVLNERQAVAEWLERRIEEEQQYEHDAAELAEHRRKEAERQEAEAAAAEAKRIEEEAAAHAKDFAGRLIQHVKDAGNGMIAGIVYPFPILIHELEVKILPDIERAGGYGAEIENCRTETLRYLHEAFERQKEESRAQAQREAAEQAAREAQEAIDAAKREAEEAKEREQRAEERRQREADEQKRRDIEAEEQRVAAAARAEEEAQRREKAAKEQERQRIEQERLAQERADQERAADLAHRKKINTTILAALVKVSEISEDQAKMIITAIAKEQVPHVRIAY